MAYFEKLNYTLSNEDTRVEYKLLKPKQNRVFSIAGSGARVLPLIARNPKVLDINDLAQEQLYLVELRLASARELSYEEHLYFLGYRGAIPSDIIENNERVDRLKLFNRLKLSKECKEFWTTYESQWSPRGFIFLGKWEDHFQKIGILFRNFLRIDVTPIFEAQTLEEQNLLYKKHFKAVVFRNFLRLVANEFVFNRFLYKGHFSGTKDVKTEKRAPWKFIDDEFRRLFTTTLVRQNYFLQILFLGRIKYEEGLPFEAQRRIFEEVKNSSTKINYHCGDLVQKVKDGPYDFISLSDTISYLDNVSAESILQSLHPQTAEGTRIVIRSFLRKPKKINTLGWVSKDDLNEWALGLDGTGVYKFHIYDKKD